MSSVIGRPLSRIAILGGGLGGLTSAYYLSRALPSSAKVLVLEKEDRFGGWVSSPEALLDKGRRCVFETGPKSVRPKGLGGMMTLDLSAKNRYIYTRNGLQKLPSSFFSLLTSVFKKPASHIPLALFKDLTNGRNAQDLQDESIKSFIGRRFGDPIGEDLISGMVHGIYAGDYAQLSARSTIFGPLWELERRHGGVLKGISASKNDESTLNEEAKAHELGRHISPESVDASVWGLRGGLETLTRELRAWLSKQPNVELNSKQPVTSICKATDHCYKVLTDAQMYDSIDHILSALPPQVLYSCLPQPLKETLEPLSQIPSVTVAVVNLAYQSTRRINPIPPAFGYLIPANIGPDLNPHRALGIVFDSDMMPGLEGESVRDELKGEVTKLTVMLGGHHYSDPNFSVPSPSELVLQASQTVKEQLGIQQNPIYAQAYVQRNCIPQYLVGHHRRMSNLHGALKDEQLSVVGCGYTGVGVNDVVRSSRETVEKLLSKGTTTGLEKFENAI